NNRDKEDDLGDLHREAGDAAEAKYGRDQCDNQKGQSPTKHGDASFIQGRPFAASCNKRAKCRHVPRAEGAHWNTLGSATIYGAGRCHARAPEQGGRMPWPQSNRMPQSERSITQSKEGTALGRPGTMPPARARKITRAGRTCSLGWPPRRRISPVSRSPL